MIPSRQFPIFLIASFLMLVHLSCRAQGNDAISIEGIVIDENGEAVPFVNIANISANIGTASNGEGRFSIVMERADTLLFSSIGFKEYQFNLQDDVDTRQLDITIQMNTTSLELEPVKVFAYRDERAFKKAILDMDLPIEEEQRIIIPGVQYSGPRREVKPNVLSPVTLVQNLFSKEAKELKKYAKVSKEHESWRKNVYEKYNPVIVKEITGLPEDEVGDFMKFCEIGDSFIRLSNQYEIVVAVQRCYDNYLKKDEQQPKVEN